MTLILTYVAKIMTLSDLQQILTSFVRKLFTVKVSNYFPDLHKKSDNFR